MPPLREVSFGLPVTRARQIVCLFKPEGSEAAARLVELHFVVSPRFAASELVFPGTTANPEVGRASSGWRDVSIVPGKPSESVRRSKAAQAAFAFKSRGGARPGSGPKRTGPRPLVPHRERARVPSDSPALVTVRLIPGFASLRRRAEHGVVRSALQAASRSRGFQVVEYSIQSNHVHLIVEARDRQALAAAMKGLLVRIARALNRLWERRGSVFADRYHARSLRTPREVRNALVYVLHNARKHGIAYAGPDPCSSGPWFDGWASSPGDAGRIARFRGAVAAESKARAGASACDFDSGTSGAWQIRARTWLLSVGWKRWGLIQLTEHPATNRVGKSGRTSKAVTPSD